MTLSLHHTTSPLFLKLGRIIHAAKTLDTARETTVPAEIEDIADQFGITESLAMRAIVDPLDDSIDALRSSGDAAMQTLKDVFQATIIQSIKEHEQQPSDGIDDALAELLRQMYGLADPAGSSQPGTVYVEYNAPTVTVGTGTSYVTGDGTIVATNVDRHGRPIPFAFNETIFARVQEDGSFRFTGELAADSKLAYNWPAGSGVDASVSSVGVDSNANLIDGGSFEEASDNDDNLPSGWLKGTGTAAALVTITAVETQTVTISSTPSDGYYILTWAQGGVTQNTESIAWDASAADVQEALRALDGLENVTVESTGTSPDFTHTVTFTGVPNPATLGVIDGLVSGSVATALVTAGSAFAFTGARAVKFDSDGAGTGSILIQRLTLDPSTCYCLAFRAAKEGAVSDGSFIARLTSSIGGGAILDEQGTANELSVGHAGFSTGLTWHTTFFRTPAVLPDAVYLELKIDAAFTGTCNLYLDTFILAPTTELYPGGPHVAIIDGVTEFEEGDVISLAVANSYGDEIQQAFNRFCDFAENDQQLPTLASVAAAVNEVQTLTSTASGGTFTITYAGQTTGNIAFDASAATIQAALEGLSNIAVGDVTCGGGDLDAAPVTITFTGTLGGQNIAEVTVDNALATGGTVVPSTTTPGVNFLADSVFVV